MSQASKRHCDCEGGLNWGGRVGQQAQSWLSETFQKGFRDLTGFGDYHINSNSLVKGGISGVSSSAPSVTYGAAGREVRIKFKEYVGDVFTHPTEPGEFYQQNYSLNPGLLDNFPWLSTIAQQYQQWIPNGVVYEFTSTSGDITTSQALGKVIIATDYNTTTLDTSFTNAQEMLAEAYSQESVPTLNMLHGIECAATERARSIFFVRSGAVNTGSSLADYDLCQTTVATVGGPVPNVNLGSLWIHYDISLLKNTLHNGVQDKGTVLRRWDCTGVGVTANTPFGSSRVLVSGTGRYANGCPRLGVMDEDIVVTPHLIYFPRWAAVGSKWRVQWHMEVATAALNTAAIAVESSSVGIDVLGQEPVPLTQSNTNRSSNTVYIEITSNTALERPKLFISYGDRFVTGTITGSLEISQLPSWYTY